MVHAARQGQVGSAQLVVHTTPMQSLATQPDNDISSIAGLDV